VADLAEHFAALASTRAVEVRLSVVETNSCRKFHADWVTMRLITTYTGAGTQWVTPADAERIAAGQEPLAIHALAPGDVGIFRGRLAAGRPAVHRSPPIAGTGIRRLLLVIDPAGEAD
jgi:hypothetical protein